MGSLWGPSWRLAATLFQELRLCGNENASSKKKFYLKIMSFLVENNKILTTRFDPSAISFYFLDTIAMSVTVW